MAYFGDMTTIYHGKYYQKKFRRQVLWDFGDGTKIEGYTAEHSYKKPGRYKVTCTFFDINRQAWVNDYCIYVVVKEVLPTAISFYQPRQEKQDIFCSKIERIATL
jgi:PKD repeat protein